jgi:hypothetical protein
MNETGKIWGYCLFTIIIWLRRFHVSSAGITFIAGFGLDRMAANSASTSSEVVLSSSSLPADGAGGTGFATPNIICCKT